MQSPKFPIKQADIKEVIDSSRLKSRWREKVRDAMRTQPIPDPVEHLDFHVSLEGACASIAAEVCSGTYVPQAPIRLLAEKSKGLCRQLVIPAAKDALVLQTLSDALWGELKAKAPSKTAFYAPNDHRFSKPVKGQDDDYGPISAWLNFQETIFGFTKAYKYIIVTDIANYYDFISYDHLRHILADLSIAREHSLDLLIFTLSHMLWQPDYMPRVQVGLPQMDLDGARMLAHCFLFDIDKFLVSVPNASHTRFMDDIDIGVDSLAVAKRILRDLDLALQTRQIRLNSGKTKILTEAEAVVHFRIDENELLDLFEEHIEKRRGKLRPIENSRKLLVKSIARGLEKRSFSDGNGEKILKRCVNYSRVYGAEIGTSAFRRILFDFPGSRGTILQWWQHSSTPVRGLEIIRDFVRSDEIVDDLSVVRIATALVNARLPSTVMVDLLLQDIIEGINSRTSWELYASLWILSKYGADTQLVELVEKTHRIWTTSEPLSRLVAGLYPRILGTSNLARFNAIMRKLSNRWSRNVYDFHVSLSTRNEGYTAVEKFVGAPNKSLPNRITHSKFLMLISVAHNMALAPISLAKLKTTHSFALEDGYYALLMP